MDKPKVTIIIPSYNHARYLPKRIESILQQSYTAYELIIIDDYSSDESNNVIEKYVNLHKIKYIRNTINSGTPFSSWEKGVSMALGKYIWICESDDFADQMFLERAVKCLEENHNCAIYYCNSNIVDEDNRIIGNTSEYFDEIWKDNRWKESFISEGRIELEKYQIFGQTVPNMSSALIRQEAFKKSYSESLLHFKLTGDWLFIGMLMLHGDVVFDVDSLSNFRKHQITSRVRVKSARSQAEFILTKYYLHKAIGHKDKELLELLKNDAIRYIYEDATMLSVLKEMLNVSVQSTIFLTIKVLKELIFKPKYIQNFLHKKKSTNIKKLNE